MSCQQPEAVDGVATVVFEVDFGLRQSPEMLLVFLAKLVGAEEAVGELRQALLLVRCLLYAMQKLDARRLEQVRQIGMQTQIVRRVRQITGVHFRLDRESCPTERNRTLVSSLNNQFGLKRQQLTRNDFASRKQSVHTLSQRGHVHKVHLEARKFPAESTW